MFYLVLLLSFFQTPAETPKRWNVRNEEIVFRRNFVQAPYITTGKDSIAFFFDKDSVISAVNSWTPDNEYVWVKYKEEGNHDFWETYLREKYGKKYISNRHMQGFPKAYMMEFFRDHDIDVKEIILYYAYSINPHYSFFNFCRRCYTGTDFLIKIKKSDLKKFDGERLDSFLELGNYYW